MREQRKRSMISPIGRLRWKLFEIFLTFTCSYWQSLGTTMNHSTTYFTLYERFLSFCSSRFTTISFVKSIKPSLPHDVISMIEHKQLILNLFRRTRHPYYAVALRDISKIVQKVVFNHKRNSWLSYCKSLNDCNIKNFWLKMKRHFNSRTAPIEGFIVNNNVISTPKEMCLIAKDYYEDQFSSHSFSQSAIESEARRIDATIEDELSSQPPVPLSFTYDQLNQSIASLKNKLSTGTDGVSNKILKLLPRNHRGLVLKCFNNFTSILQTPPHWHVAKMILLLKTKSKVANIDETRPTSLLPCFSKLFEKCFMIHFRKWIHDQGILPDEQSGFRPGHNMAVRLVSIIDQIGQSLAKNTAAAALFVDFRTAFNQLWFDGLWVKLHHLHCPMQLIAWLRHYLKGRSAYIDIKNESSSLFNLSKGVPQGNCIGPVLFIIYHYDVLEALSTIHWKHLFADDLAILISSSPTMSSQNLIHALTEEIKQVLRRLIDYSIKWKQPINYNKTFWTLFHRQVDPKIIEIRCKGHTIKHVNKFKYLGTILDAKLTFNAHIDYIKSKIRKNLNIFKRLASSRMLSDEVNYRLHNAYIRPHLQSLLNIYPILSTYKKKQLEGFNRQFFRTIHYWYDARNIEIENLPRFRSIDKLTHKHWKNLFTTILNTNPSIIQDYIQHKMSILYLNEYLTNPCLIKERRKIFNKGRIRNNVLKLMSETYRSLFDLVLGFQ